VATLEKQNYLNGLKVPTVKCSGKESEKLALQDLKITDLTERKGLYHCFCKNMQDKKGDTITKNFMFKTDGNKTHCADWIKSIDEINFNGKLIAGTVGMINVGVEIFIGLGSEFITRPRNYQQVVLDTVKGISGI